MYRDEAKFKLKNLTAAEKNALDKKIFKNLIKLKEFQNAKEVFTYVSFDNEVDTIEIIKYSIQNNKKIYVPKIVKGENKLEVCKLNSIQHLKQGTFNIPEPADECIVFKNKFDVLLLPGLCFDSLGYRLGRGAGYFDRFLPEVEGIKIGLCFSFQIVKRLPVESHDIKMDIIVTDTKVFRH